MKLNQFRQASIKEWPPQLIYSGAVLRDNPDRLSGSLAVTFERSFDDLGQFEIVILIADTGHQIALIRYVDSTLPGTTVMLDRDILKASAAWYAFRRHFAIKDDDCLTIDSALTTA